MDSTRIYAFSATAALAHHWLQFCVRDTTRWLEGVSKIGVCTTQLPCLVHGSALDESVRGFTAFRRIALRMPECKNVGFVCGENSRGKLNIATASPDFLSFAVALREVATP